VNGVAGFRKYGGPCVIVDFGTTINFDVVSRDGDYLGGAIAVGVGIAVEALFARTARLPLVEFRPPKTVIGTNTVASMQSDYIMARWEWSMASWSASSSNWARYEDRRYRRPGRPGGFRLALFEGGRRTSDAGRPANDLGAVAPAVTPEPDFLRNYFNYFTEVEEHFQRARGTALFLMSRSIGRWWKPGRMQVSRSKPCCAALMPPSRSGAAAG